MIVFIIAPVYIIICQNMFFPKSFSPRCSSVSSSYSTNSPSAASAHAPAPVCSDDEGEYVVVTRPAKKDGRARVDRRTELNKDLRVMEYDLVLATGLMQELNTTEILSRNCYFGRYGTVEKVIISSKHDSFSAKNKNVQAFVTYRNELDSAFAIAAIRDIKHHHYHSIKAHYGTSRYCNRFIEGEQCQNRGCFFNHSLRENHMHKHALQATVEGQYQRVYKIILENLEYFVEKEYQQFKNRAKLEKEVFCNCWRKSELISFPSCKEVIQGLISQGIIDQTTYDTIKSKIKGQNTIQSQRYTSLQTENKENKRQQLEAKIEDSSSKLLEKSSLTSHNGQQQIKVPSLLSIPSQMKDLLKDMPRRDNDLRNKKGHKTSQTLEEYIENNIINEQASFSSQNNDLTNFLQERIHGKAPFRDEKVGEILNRRSSCQLKGLNPQMDVSEYVANKIIKKTFVGYKFSRFDFAKQMDGKTQASQESKFRYIIGCKLINFK